MVAIRGFSLIEILVVTALIAVITTILVGALGGGTDGVRLRGAARDLAAQLRYARGQAIVSGRSQTFTLNTADRTWTVDERRYGELPRGIEVTLTTARIELAAPDVARIRFFADGSATGGRLSLRLREAQWRVEVSWLTGEVRLARGSGEP